MTTTKTSLWRAFWVAVHKTPKPFGHRCEVADHILEQTQMSNEFKHAFSQRSNKQKLFFYMGVGAASLRVLSCVRRRIVSSSPDRVFFQVAPSLLLIGYRGCLRQPWSGLCPFVYMATEPLSWELGKVGQKRSTACLGAACCGKAWNFFSCYACHVKLHIGAWFDFSRAHCAKMHLSTQFDMIDVPGFAKRICKQT